MREVIELDTLVISLRLCASIVKRFVLVASNGLLCPSFLTREEEKGEKGGRKVRPRYTNHRKELPRLAGRRVVNWGEGAVIVS